MHMTSITPRLWLLSIYCKTGIDLESGDAARFSYRGDIQSSRDRNMLTYSLTSSAVIASVTITSFT